MVVAHYPPQIQACRVFCFMAVCVWCEVGTYVSHNCYSITSTFLLSLSGSVAANSRLCGIYLELHTTYSIHVAYFLLCTIFSDSYVVIMRSEEAICLAGQRKEKHTFHRQTMHTCIYMYMYVDKAQQDTKPWVF